MPSKTASIRVDAKVAAKSARHNGAKPQLKKPRMTRIEAERLARFKELMLRTGGKGQFAGLDE